ncbi:MAG: Sec-independent protein translocase protein TatB [Gallionella sp.]|nr:Sec-independent protein translocase protein TatB [Gallionella sp.]
MFDIAFSEMLVILLVALVVIGPQRLPKVARTAGHVWGRAQRYMHNIKSRIANDMALEEARQLHGNISKGAGEAAQYVQNAGLSLEQKISQVQHGKIFDAINVQAQPAAQPLTPSKPA